MRSVAVCCLLTAIGTAACSSAPVYPGYNRLVIPKTTGSIVPDGVIGAEEWADAAAVTGLCRAGGHDLLPQEQQTWFYLTYDDHNLYMAMHSLNFPAGTRPKTDTRSATDSSSKLSTSNIVRYDHYDLQFSPSPDPLHAQYKYYYKFLGNHRDSLQDRLTRPSIGNWGFRWNSGARFANKVTDAAWDAEIAIPFTNLDGAAPADFDTWLMWLIRAYNDDTSGTFTFLWGGDPWIGWDNPAIIPVAAPRVTFHRLGDG